MRSPIRLVTALATAAMTAGVLFAAAADARTDPVLATYQLAPGFYELAHGHHAVWAANIDEFDDGQIYRIAPDRPHPLKLVRRMPFPVGGLAVAFGSLWVSDYYGNAVWRLDAHGRTEARIATGLQPQWLHAAFGSMWVSNHHGASLSRVDPATNTVQATDAAGAPGAFRSGPQDLTDDGTNLFVASSNQQALQLIDPTTDTTTTADATDDVFCGPLAAVGGYVWSVDSCTGAFYRFASDGSVEQTIPSAGLPGGVVAVGSHVWLSDDTQVDPDTGVGSAAVLTERDPATGEVLRTIDVGGDALDITKGFGDLWVYDSYANTVRRVDR